MTKATRIRIQKIAAEARLANLNDRAVWILQASDLETAGQAYIQTFGSYAFSNDLYEENAILCSELGCDNLLDT